MSTIIQLCGLPGSGKSTYAKSLSEKMGNATILSSDNLRVELYGDINHQGNNGELFQELHRRAKENLKSGNNVIVDATNINQNRRASFVREFSSYNKEAHYISTPYLKCLYNDMRRDRTVGRDVIERIYTGLQVPTYLEGWDKVKIVDIDKERIEYKQSSFESAVSDPSQSHDRLFKNLYCATSFIMFDDIYNLPHDSKWHSLSVSRHTYEVWKYVIENYHEDDKYKMLLVALFHDVGKASCKQFKGGSRYANFYGHENVSGKLTCRLLTSLGYETEFILSVVDLVQLHMKLLSIGDSEKGKEKLKGFVGEDIYNKLVFFREADEQAH